MHSLERTSAARGLGPIAAAIVPFLVVAGIAAGHGIPAFQHDWLWPGSRLQAGNVAFAGMHAWRREGLGAPALYPLAWWVWLAAGASVFVAGPHLGLDLFAYAALAFAAWGFARCAAAYGAAPMGEVFATILAVGNPFVLNELQAGHLDMLWGYALLPHALATARTGRTWGGALAAGVLCGLAGAQQQYVVFAAAAIVAALAADRKRWKYLPAILLVAAIVNAPEWVLLADGVRAARLDAMLPLRHWALVESSAPADAIRLLGYPAGYEQRLLPPLVAAALWLLPLLAVAGLAVRRGIALELAAIAAVALAVTTGLRGPAAPIWSAFQAHSIASALFREFYDAAGAAALALSVLAALALSAPRAAGAAARAAALMLAAAACFTAIRAPQGIPRYSVPARAYERAAAVPGNGRILALPAAQPATTGSGRVGGYAPLLLGIGAHPSAVLPSTPAAVLYAASLHGAAERAWLSRLDVAAAVPQPGLRTAFAQVVEPSLRGALPRSTPEESQSYASIDAHRVAVEPFSARPGTLAARYRGARDLRAVAGGRRIALIPLERRPDPRTDWARTALWPVLPSWVFSQPASVFTLRTHAVLAIPPALVVAGSARGPVRGCPTVLRLDAHFSLLRCGARPALQGAAPLVVAEAVAGGRPATPLAPSGARGAVQPLDESASSITARIAARAGSALVLRESYDARWGIDVPGARHVVVDGYANGWVLPRDVDGVVHIRFAPAPLFHAALAASMFAVLMLALVPLARRRPALHVRVPRDARRRPEGRV